jgi:hypothetical protein
MYGRSVREDIQSVKITIGVEAGVAMKDPDTESSVGVQRQRALQGGSDCKRQIDAMSQVKCHCSPSGRGNERMEDIE